MQILPFLSFFDPKQAFCWRPRSRYTLCPIVVLFLASMTSTAADKVGKLKNQHNVATHSGLAEQSYVNVMHGGILFLVLLLLLAGSLPRAMELFRDWLKHSPGVRPARMTLSEVMNEDTHPLIPATQCCDPDAVQRICDAAAAGRERRLLEAKRQRGVLAAAVKDYRMARDEWHQQHHDEVSYCQSVLHDGTVCVRTPKRAWRAVEHEWLHVMDHFQHKQRLRPAMHELLGKLCIQQDSPPATPSSVPAPVEELSAFQLGATVRGRPVERRRKKEPGHRAQRTPTQVRTLSPVQLFEDIVRMPVGRVPGCPCTPDPVQETQPQAVQPPAGLDPIAREQLRRKVVASARREAAATKMRAKEWSAREALRLGRVQQTSSQAHSTPPVQSYRELWDAQVASQEKFAREQAARMEVWCAKAKRIEAIERASGGDPDSVRIFQSVIGHLGYNFIDGLHLTGLTPGVHVDNRPDHALMRAQAEYRAEQLARTSRADTSTATDYSPGAAVMSDPDPVTEPVRVRLPRHTVCQQQSEQHPVAKQEGTSQFALWLREQADLQAKKLASRISDVVRKCRSYADILAEHSRGAAVEATQRPTTCARSPSLRSKWRRRVSGLAVWKLKPEQHLSDTTCCMEEDEQQGGRAAAPHSDEIDRVSCVSCMMLLYGYALRVKLDVDPSLAVLFVMVLAVFVIPALPLLAYFSSFLEYDKRVVIH